MNKLINNWLKDEALDIDNWQLAEEVKPDHYGLVHVQTEFQVYASNIVFGAINIHPSIDCGEYITVYNSDLANKLSNLEKSLRAGEKSARKKILEKIAVLELERGAL